MHKYFAKTLFLGKKIKFLPECHSTNDELMDLVKKGHANAGDVLYTNYQKSGKGQRGNAWVSEPGKNLLFSFVISPGFLQVKQSYFLNIITGLALLKSIKPWLTGKSVELKWPNDVFVGDKKIAGILIETILEKDLLQSAVVGVGVNINQRSFHLNSATSLHMETEVDYDREEVLELLLLNFESLYLQLKAGDFSTILHEYYKCMRWRGEIRHYKSGDTKFSGEIIGIGEYGRLVVKAENAVRHFDVKEIEFLY